MLTVLLLLATQAATAERVPAAARNIPAEVAAALELVRHRDAHVRRRGVVSLGELAAKPYNRAVHRSAVPALVNAMVDRDSEVRTAAAAAVAACMPAVEDHALLSAARKPLMVALARGEAAVRGGAALALGAVGQKLTNSMHVAEVVQALVRATAQPEGGVRSSARRGLATAAPSIRDANVAATTILPLAEALHDRDVEARLGAALALTRLVPRVRQPEVLRPALPTVLQALRDEDLHARGHTAVAAALLAFELKDQSGMLSCVAPLSYALLLGCAEVRLGATDALHRLALGMSEADGLAGALGPLIGAAKDEDLHTRSHAACAAAFISLRRNDEGTALPLVPTLIEALRCTCRFARDDAVRLLTRLDTPEARAALAKRKTNGATP